MSQLEELGLSILKQRAHAKRLEFSILEKKDQTIKVQLGTQNILCVFSERLPPAIDGDVTFFIMNTKENVQALYTQWGDFSNKPGLILYFLDTKTGAKWSIKPYVHNQITTAQSLKNGLFSLYNNSIV